MATISVNEDKCKSCQFCVRYCPRKALFISERSNSKGYSSVAVDSDKCVGCGTCYLMCPDSVFEISGGKG